MEEVLKLAAAPGSGSERLKEKYSLENLARDAPLMTQEQIAEHILEGEDPKQYYSAIDTLVSMVIAQVVEEDSAVSRKYNQHLLKKSAYNKIVQNEKALIAEQEKRESAESRIKEEVEKLDSRITSLYNQMHIHDSAFESATKEIEQMEKDRQNLLDDRREAYGCQGKGQNMAEQLKVIGKKLYEIEIEVPALQLARAKEGTSLLSSEKQINELSTQKDDLMIQYKDNMLRQAEIVERLAAYPNIRTSLVRKKTRHRHDPRDDTLIDSTDSLIQKSVDISLNQSQVYSEITPKKDLPGSYLEHTLDMKDTYKKESDKFNQNLDSAVAKARERMMYRK